jgi:enoyl-CoA hydratase/carnithine racemase
MNDDNRMKDDNQMRDNNMWHIFTKFFSFGLDIPSLFDVSKDDFPPFRRAFNGVCPNLFTLPKTTIAAITGHATAGGCVLAFCCDYHNNTERKN